MVHDVELASAVLYIPNLSCTAQAVVLYRIAIVRFSCTNLGTIHGLLGWLLCILSNEPTWHMPCNVQCCSQAYWPFTCVQQAGLCCTKMCLRHTV